MWSSSKLWRIEELQAEEKTDVKDALRCALSFII